MSKKERGFFVKYDDGKYSKPYNSLNEARADARLIGPSLKIFHGLLIIEDDGKVDASELFLVPKLPKK